MSIARNLQYNQRAYFQPHSTLSALLKINSVTVLSENYVFRQIWVYNIQAGI